MELTTQLPGFQLKKCTVTKTQTVRSLSVYIRIAPYTVIIFFHFLYQINKDRAPLTHSKHLHISHMQKHPYIMLYYARGGKW